MKKSTTWTIVIIVVILIGGVLFFSYNRSTNTPTTTTAKNTETTSTISTSSEPVVCDSNDSYFAISEESSDEPGSSIIVKAKSSPSQTFPCQMTASTNDFQLTNASAEYYLGLSGHYLLTDNGTAPEPRGLQIYNLETQKKVFQDVYSRPVEITSTSTTYWTPSKTPPTTAICSELETNTKNGLGTTMEAEVRLNLETMIKTSTGATRCEPLQ